MSLTEQSGVQEGIVSFGHHGHGYFAGEPSAVPGDPESPDGLARILNVPSTVRVCVYDRRTMQCIASTLSDSDGSWRIDYLDEQQFYVVIGFDGAGRANAAIHDWVKPALMD